MKSVGNQGPALQNEEGLSAAMRSGQTKNLRLLLPERSRSFVFATMRKKEGVGGAQSLSLPFPTMRDAVITRRVLHSLESARYSTRIPEENTFRRQPKAGDGATLEAEAFRAVGCRSRHRWRTLVSRCAGLINLL